MTCWVRREPILAGYLTATVRSNFPKQRSNKQSSPVGWLGQGGPGAAFRDGDRGGYWRGGFEVNHGVGGGTEASCSGSLRPAFSATKWDWGCALGVTAQTEIGWVRETLRGRSTYISARRVNVLFARADCAYLRWVLGVAVRHCCHDFPQRFPRPCAGGKGFCRIHAHHGRLRDVPCHHEASTK